MTACCGRSNGVWTQIRFWLRDGTSQRSNRVRLPVLKLFPPCRIGLFHGSKPPSPWQGAVCGILEKYQNEIKRRQGVLPLEWHWRLKLSGRFSKPISATKPTPCRQKYRFPC